MIDAALATLKDIDGVYGSFVIDRDGRLKARDLPAVFDEQALGDAGPRIVRLWEVISEDETPEYTLLEFSEYWLFVRAVPNGNLCVVVPPWVNVSALRMAASLVAKRVDADAPPADDAAPPAFEPGQPGGEQNPLLALKRTLFWGRRQQP